MDNLNYIGKLEKRINSLEYENFKLKEKLSKISAIVNDISMLNEEQDTDYKWFEENLKLFLKFYRDKYLIIYKCKVMGVCESFSEALEKASQEYESGTFIIQQCTDEPIHIY